MLTLIMVAGLSTTSCVQNDNPIVADVSSGVQSNKAKEPTTDRMGVLVTADVPCRDWHIRRYYRCIAREATA